MIKDSSNYGNEEDYYNSESEGKEFKDHWQKEINTKTEKETTSD